MPIKSVLGGDAGSLVDVALPEKPDDTIAS
jgi:hypothetical protein